MTAARTSDVDSEWLDLDCAASAFPRGTGGLSRSSGRTRGSGIVKHGSFLKELPPEKLCEYRRGGGDGAVRVDAPLAF